MAEINKFEIELSERQSQLESKYKITPCKDKIPKGRFCNPNLESFCPYLATDYCLKYHKALTTDARMHEDIFRHRKASECK